jgi:hypothetical protein
MQFGMSHSPGEGASASDRSGCEGPADFMHRSDDGDASVGHGAPVEDARTVDDREYARVEGGGGEEGEKGNNAERYAPAALPSSDSDRGTPSSRSSAEELLPDVSGEAVGSSSSGDSSARDDQDGPAPFAERSDKVRENAGDEGKQPAPAGDGGDTRKDECLRGNGPLKGSLRLKGAHGSPTWLETSIACWREVAHADPAGRTAFSLKELVDFAAEHWDQICWCHKLRDEWPKMLGRGVRHGKVNGKACFLYVGEGLYMLRDDLGHDAAGNEYVTDVESLAMRASKFVWRGSSNGGTSKRSEPHASSAAEKDSRPAKRRRTRKPLSNAVEEAEVPAESVGLEFPVKKIPSEWMTVPPGPVRLSTLDRAPDLTFLDEIDDRGNHGSCLTVRGFKGYRMVRATHGVCEGDWYFEAAILPAEETGSAKAAVRLGWSTRRADVETPVGADEHGYGIRDTSGQFIHDARLMDYGASFGVGDYIGCRISLPGGRSEETRAKIAEADEAWLTFRQIWYLQGKPPPNVPDRVRGAHMEFFKNGVSQGVPAHFRCDGNQDETTGITAGMYFPSVALFKGSIVKVNFGPDFKYPLPAGSQPFCECAPVLPPPSPVQVAPVPESSHIESSTIPYVSALNTEDSAAVADVKTSADALEMPRVLSGDDAVLTTDYSVAGADGVAAVNMPGASPDDAAIKRKRLAPDCPGTQDLKTGNGDTCGMDTEEPEENVIDAEFTDDRYH